MKKFNLVHRSGSGLLLLSALLFIWQPALAEDSPFLVLERNLQPLKDAFNEQQGRVRLMLVVGPTCGICLRGMVDMDEDLLGTTDDPFLKTFVVHVPVLGAQQKHVAATLPLIDNIHTSHYWDSVGTIGLMYRKVLDVNMYAWDIWMLYGPEAVWNEDLPPNPDFWMHQLGPLPKEKYLDTKVLAERTLAKLDSLQRDQIAETKATRPKDSSEYIIEIIGQPSGQAIGQHIRGRGGYDNLKTIDLQEFEGSILVGSQELALKVTRERGGDTRRAIGVGEQTSLAIRHGDTVRHEGSKAHRGLSPELERMLLLGDDFDGLLVDWKRKGHAVERTLDMSRYDGVLNWKLDVRGANNSHWNVFVSSVNGMVTRRTLLDKMGVTLLDIRYKDFRVVEAARPFATQFPYWYDAAGRGFINDKRGYPFPHRVEYREAHGELLAVEQFEKIQLTVGSAARTASVGE